MPYEEGAAGDHPAEDHLEELGTGALRPPPHPDDRLWRHPSELKDLPRRTMRAAQGTSRPLNPTRTAGTPWGLLTLAGGFGAAVAAAAMTLVGVSEHIVERRVTERVAVTPALSSPGTTTGDRLEDQEPTLMPSADAHDQTRDVEAAMVLVGGVDATGLGFVLRDDGKVLTSASVVGRDAEAPVAIILPDGREVTGHVQGTDPVTDVAVVGLPEGDYPTAVLADPGRTFHGNKVVVAAQDGDTARWTEGVVTSSSWRLTRHDLPTLNGLLQIQRQGEQDVAGGPVLDEFETVVGMTVRSTTDWSYATPVEVATKVADDLLATGEAQHGWLGITGHDAMDERLTAGVFVSDIHPHSPLHDELQTGDVIVSLDGVPVPDMATLQGRLLLYRPGDQVEVSYHRDGGEAPEVATVGLQARP